MIEAGTFFSSLFAIANKSSIIAQIIRKETSLFDLLVENKDTNEYLNFDYKTFADVLIQETARYDLTTLYEELGEKLLGEENNRFTNKLNVSVEVKVCKKINETKDMILKVVDNRMDLADQLSKIIHTNINEFCDEDYGRKANVFKGKILSLNEVEMWIDPIDSTKEYVNGVGLDGQTISEDIDCIRNATVLLGAYNNQTGIPFAGVVCQPFNHINVEGLWTHRCYWGIHFDLISLCSDNIHKRQFSMPGQVITAYREVDNLSRSLNCLSESIAWNVSGKFGAGFKLLSLLTSLNDVCILTKGSTYKWDTCGPHGILLSVGGGLADYQKIMHEISSRTKDLPIQINVNNYIKELLEDYQVGYVTKESNRCNSGGFIAYTNADIAVSVIKSLLQI